MPLYDFHCNNCGKEFELALGVKDYERKDFDCPGCRSKDLERTMAGVGVITAKKS